MFAEFHEHLQLENQNRPESWLALAKCSLCAWWIALRYCVDWPFLIKTRGWRFSCKALLCPLTVCASIICLRKLKNLISLIYNVDIFQILFAHLLELPNYEVHCKLLELPTISMCSKLVENTLVFFFFPIDSQSLSVALDHRSCIKYELLEL